MSMSIHEDFLQLITENFQQLKRRNPRYSLRAYAKKLEVSPGTLSEVMRAKLKLKPERMEKILYRLDIPVRRKNHLLLKMGKTAHHERQIVSKEAALFLAPWPHRAALHFFDLETENLSAVELSQRLDISLAETKKCLNQLLKLELLEVNEKGDFRRPQKIWHTTDGENNESVRLTHLSNFELEKKAYQAFDKDEKDFTAMMFAGNRAQLEHLRKEIRKLYEKTILTMENGPRDELYQISVSVYPIRFNRE